MNTLKFALVLCSVVVVSCSNHYMQAGRPSWEAPSATGQMWNYAHDASTAAPNTNYEQSHLTTDAPDNSAYTTAPSASAQPSYAAPPAPTNTNIPASAFPTVTKQICTCVAVPDSNAATEQSSPAQQASPAQGSYAAQAAAPSQTTSASQSYAAQSAQTTSSHGSSYGAQGTTGDRVAKAYAANKGNGY